jgi:hypothetical protein
MLPNLFYIICFSLSIVASIINLLFGFIIITVVTTNRRCCTITNLGFCNTAVATAIYSILQLIAVGYGLREDWFRYQPACVLRAYFYTAIAGAVCGSYAVQSISRLFFAVLYKHKYLLTWRIHWFMIAANYLIAMLGTIAPIFFGSGYGLELESRMCIGTTKIFYSSMLIVTVAFLIPFSIVTILYAIIFYHAQQSTRRIVAFANNRTTVVARKNCTIPNFKRELKLMRNILILVCILICGGIPYLILVLWHATQKQSPPTPFYLLAMIAISIVTAAKMVTLFCMNKEVKNITVKYLRKMTRF